MYNPTTLSGSSNRILGLWSSWLVRYDALRRVLERRVWLNRWFPHVPLALGVLPLGLLLMNRASRSILGRTTLVSQLEELAALRMA